MPFFPPGAGGGGGTVTQVDFPLSGTGAIGNPLVVGPGLAGTVQHVSGSGSDVNDGLTLNTAKLTTDSALAVLKAAGGGELNVYDGAQGNIWMRGDGAAVPGFVNANMALKVIGHGSAYGEFGDPAALLYGGSTTDRRHPVIWILSSISHPILIENIVPATSNPNWNTNCFVRMWDYKRYADLSIAFSNITSWHRTVASPDAATPGAAVLTLALPTARNVVSAQRLSNVTTLVVTTPAAPQGLDVSDFAGNTQWIKFTSTSGSFTTGEYHINAGSLGSLDSGVTWFFSFPDPGTDTAVINAPGTYQSSQICVGDRIEVESTDPEVITSAYRVTGVTDATHITVMDPFGYSPRSATGTFTNPGTYVYQDRTYGSGLVTLRNLMGTSSAAIPDLGFNGPMIDIANTSDGRILVEKTSLSGLADPVVDCHDPDRACWLLADPGAKGVCGLTVRDSRPAAGGIRIYGSLLAAWGIDASNIQGDNAIGFDGPPALEVLSGNANCTLLVNNVTTIDQASDIPNIVIDTNCLNGFVKVSNCGIVTSPGEVSGLSVSTGQNAWAVRTESAETMGQWGFWSFDSFSAKHPSQWRSVPGLSSARYLNKCPAPGSWTLNGATKTDNQIDPFGGTTAIKLSGSANVEVYSVSQSIAVGDRWLFGCWVKNASGQATGPGGYVLAIGTSGNDEFLGLAGARFKGDGEWQWILAKTGPAAINATENVNADIGVSSVGDLIVCQPTLLKIPAGDMSDNEFNEFASYFRGQPLYLPAGMDGTNLNRKFIGHGGFGTNSANANTVGVGSGQLTLTGTGTVYLPTYDADGTTIIGWVAQLQATINP